MHLRELLASGVSGAVATAVDVATLVLLVHWGTPIAPAAFFGAVAGAAVCFLMNKHVAFRDRSKVTWSQLGRFGLVAVATALLMALAMQIACVGFGAPLLVAKPICSAAVFALWSYPAQKKLVFLSPARSYS